MSMKHVSTANWNNETHSTVQELKIVFGNYAPPALRPLSLLLFRFSRAYIPQFNK